MWNAAGGGILWLAKGCRRLPLGTPAADGTAVPTVVPQDKSKNINIWHDVLDPVDRCGSVAVNMFEYGVRSLGLRRMLELNIVARKSE